MQIVPCISLHQPFASALFLSDPAGARLKTHETRTRQFPRKYQGHRVAIQAALRPPELGELERTLLAGAPLPLGKVLGTVIYVGAARMLGPGVGAQPVSAWDELFGDWSPGRWAMLTADPQPLPEPIPWRGQQGWFSVELP